MESSAKPKQTPAAQVLVSMKAFAKMMTTHTAAIALMATMATIATKLSIDATQIRVKMRRSAPNKIPRTAALAAVASTAQIVLPVRITVSPARAKTGPPVIQQKLPTHVHALAVSWGRTVMHRTHATLLFHAITALVTDLMAQQHVSAPWVGTVQNALKKQMNARVHH